MSNLFVDFISEFVQGRTTITLDVLQDDALLILGATLHIGDSIIISSHWPIHPTLC